MHNVEKEIHYRDLVEVVDKAISELPARRQEIFRLGRMQGFSHKEIAKKLSISEKTIETHMRLALRDVKTALSPLIDKIL